MGISWDGVVNFQGSFEGIAVGLYGFDLCEVVLDIDEVFVGDDRQQELFVVGQEGVAEGCCGLEGVRLWGGEHA
jgi:hypothetical protein